MSLKIFLPRKLYAVKENFNIYGEIKINDRNAISYYVITAIGCREITRNSQLIADRKEIEFSSTLRHLGLIVNASDILKAERRDVALCFAYDNLTPNIYLHKLSIKLNQETSINVLIYDEDQILKLQDLEEDLVHYAACTGGNKLCPNDDMQLLYQLVKQRNSFIQISSNIKHQFHITQLIYRLCRLPFNFLNMFFTLCVTMQPLKFIFQRMVLYEHYQEWLKFKHSGKRHYNIVIDKFLGICVMLLLLFYFSHPGDYLIETSHFIVIKLRTLLNSLRGAPIGLKLNVQLNGFLLDCFGYHVHLWATFLDLIEPFVRKLFVPIALLGAMGLSYQLASLTDLITIMGLHAHCFSIYSAVLYKVEIKGLQVLWKVVLGKRKNLLKNRVESHNYKNRQLYLTTIFFASLLFLFPTILTYYIVFTTLRLCIFLFNLILKTLRRHLLEFPFEMLIRWCSGNLYNIALELEYLQHIMPLVRQPQIQMPMLNITVFILHIHSSSLSRVFSSESGILKELEAKEKNTIKSICQGILVGKF
ncbi:phosphatidylinositol glycan anchor biosynthesis class Q isoform 2-T2 [Glossina fuscipes fuscipes]